MVATIEEIKEVYSEQVVADAIHAKGKHSKEYNKGDILEVEVSGQSSSIYIEDNHRLWANIRTKWIRLKTNRWKSWSSSPNFICWNKWSDFWKL